jgi:hypothetical protein
MANIIRIKGNGTSGTPPSDLQYRELALNYADKRLYFKNADNQIDYFAATSGGIGEADVNELVLHGVFPIGDYGDFGIGTVDAFGVRTNFRTYDAMSAEGYLRTVDLGTI